MSPTLVLYGLAALVGVVLGGPPGLLAAALLVAVVAARHRLTHRPPAGISPGRAAAGGAR